MALSFLQTAGDATDLTTYTFSSQNLGATASDRFIICAITGRSSDGSARTLSSATIGGVTATINCQINNSGSMSAIVAASVPTGTTGDVVLVFSSTMTDANIALYRATGLSSATAIDTGTSSADPGTDTLTIKSGGVLVGIATDDDGTHTCTWTGLTENYDSATAGGRDFSGAMAENSSVPNVVISTNLSVTADWNAAASRPTFSVASFEVVDTSSPTNLTLTINSPSVTGTANVSITVISSTISVQAPTVTLTDPLWQNTDKNTSSWNNLDKS